MKSSLLLTATLALASTLFLACGDKDDDSGGSADDTGHSHDSGSSTDGGSDGGGDTSAGATVFASTCADCHGSDGTNGTAPDLSERVPTKTDEEIRTLVEDGQNYMPAQDLSSTEIDDVIAYLRATFPG
ncbi:MAG: cytochrome c [Alphaproteobacteria bacterium]|nr:cytochrome c [Alphaproteobacteria bacterium]